MPSHNFLKISVDKFLINVDYVWIGETVGSG